MKSEAKKRSNEVAAIISGSAWVDQVDLLVSDFPLGVFFIHSWSAVLSTEQLL